MNDSLEQLFPGLIGTDWRITSPPTRVYNCIAWACGVNNDWWWPGELIEHPAWPHPVPNEESVSCLRQLCLLFGYSDAEEEGFEPGYEKLALFAFSESAPTHAARQLPSGKWTSKLGFGEDIEHDLRAIEGDLYGRVVLILKRAATR